MENIMNDLRQKRASLLSEMQALTDNESMTAEQAARFDAIEVEVRDLDSQIQTAVERRDRFATISNVQIPVNSAVKSPAVLKLPRGDNEANAFHAFVTRGDKGAFRTEGNELVIPFETRAAVDSTMNITTAADGGNLVPTGLSGIVAVRKNESMLAPKLGVRKVLGVGTTVNYPVESSDPEVFATTSEQADNHGTSYERNTVATGVKAFTLVKKTRKIELTEELMQDSPINIMDYVANRIGREVAKTHNIALLAEVAANGTSFKTFASGTAIAAGELEVLAGNSALGYYLEEGANPAWITSNPTLAAINSITANPRMYGSNVNSGLLGYPVFLSGGVAAMGLSAKSIYFGNWDYVGLREGVGVNLIVDPYSVDGATILKYSFRLAYGVLQAGAVGYGVHAAS